MKHIVMIWGAHFSSEKELIAFVEPAWDEDGEAQPSAFVRSIGVMSVDEDFLEAHYLGSDREREEFAGYVKEEYAPHKPFAERLPASFEADLRDCNSIILVYGNDSPYGPVNDALFQYAGSNRSAHGSQLTLVASVEYETA